MTITGTQDSDPITLGNISLGVVARKVTGPVNLQADAFEANVRDSLRLDQQLSVNHLDLRVFGDNQNLTITQPVSATSMQFVAPDGTISMPGGTQLSGHTAVIKARQLMTTSGKLDLSVDQLTVVVQSTSVTSLLISNDRDLLLANTTDSTH
ncbi:MAG: hypothetical protein ACK5YO_28295, partial [Planctomyces sp.]